MANDFPDWTCMDEPAYFRYDDGYEPHEMYLPYIRRGKGEEPHYTPEDEERIINQQIRASQGFDIDFKMFRCIFNYQPLNFDDNNQFFTGTETTRELVERLTRESLEGFNEKKGTKYQLVKFVRAHYNETCCPAIMFYLTFQGKDPSEDEPKVFQTKICHFYHDLPKFVSCNLKPEKKVHSIETAEKEDAKKPRLTEALEQTRSILTESI
ncbi:hypothetical protein AALP_AA2G006800 [Arabis alpina]|uniref:Cystatin domain-containing protein n=1 Tax=Arabis alpina TaxID=50452 RepID=A0A087HEH2_ARAAL|nr:hypothetical protein AALP_AA2G006800 [Arabis alpina]